MILIAMKRLTVGLGTAGARLASPLAFGAGIASTVSLVGTRDMESYEHAFASLDRGTALDALHVLGQPVYTLALGFGVRLPLHGNLGASPAAALAPYLPAPLTYWSLIALAVGVAVVIARHALEPICGRLVSWLAMVLLFCSVPMVTYTIYNDWPETAVTYCALVGCVLAPHGLLALLDSPASSRVRRLGGLAAASTVWGLVALAHPGYWPLLAMSLVLTSTLALWRSDHPWRTRLTVVAALAAVSCLIVAPQIPDIVREVDTATAAGETKRLFQDVSGSIVSANVFPFGEVGDRMPFTYFFLALASLVIGLASTDAHLRRLTIGSALISMASGIGAATLPPGSSVYAPSNAWSLRDPAAVFAVLSAACAAGAMRRSRGVRRFAGAAPAVALFVLAGLQGPAYAAALVVTKMREASDHVPWTRDMVRPEERASNRGLVRERVSPGERPALWPGVRPEMRRGGRASTDFADAGYLLVTAWTKNRTMRGLVDADANAYLFNQTTDLPSQLLCDSSAVRSLQLRYLLMPAGVECPPWMRLRGVLVDGRLEVGVALESDDTVRAFPIAALSERIAREPALSASSALLPALVPLPGTSLRIGRRGVAIWLRERSMAQNHALVLPVAYDPSWRTSSGRVHNVGGLAALVGVDQRQVTVDFRPDIVAVLRTASMTIAQLLALVGFVGLGCVRCCRGACRGGRPATA